MTYWISVDPGLRNVGFAYWKGDMLVGVATAHQAEVRDAHGWRNMGAIALEVYKQTAPYPNEPLPRIVYEMPEIKSNWRKGDPNDVLQVVGGLQAVLDRLARDSTELIAVLPSLWTKGREKEANAQRTLRKLVPREIAVLEEFVGIHGDNLMQAARFGDLGHQEHAFDAVAIGLFDTRRWFV